jgi:hypothetical protein
MTHFFHQLHELINKLAGLYLSFVKFNSKSIETSNLFIGKKVFKPLFEVFIAEFAQVKSMD